MRLLTLHKIFIACVLLFSLVMVAYGLHGYFVRADSGALINGIAGFGFGIAGIFYRRWFSRKFKS